MGVNDWVSSTVIWPVLAWMFKSEIGKLFTVWNIYRLRKFDNEVWIEILNEGNGQWDSVWIDRYVFSLNAKKRGVYIRYPNGAEEKIGFVDWGRLRKRKIGEAEEG